LCQWPLQKLMALQDKLKKFKFPGHGYVLSMNIDTHGLIKQHVLDTHAGKQLSLAATDV
jgi:hypothetical protein